MSHIHATATPQLDQQRAYPTASCKRHDLGPQASAYEVANPLTTLAAASTAKSAQLLPPMHQWLAPFNGGVSLLPAHSDPSICVAVWHCATQRLMACSANFAPLVGRSLLQLQRGLSLTSLFTCPDWSTPLPAIERSGALLGHALGRVSRGLARGGTALLMTALTRGGAQCRWLAMEFVLAGQPGESTASVVTYIRETLPAFEPWLQLQETGEHEPDKELVAAPTKRRNGAKHPWDANVMHFKMTTTH